MSLKCLQNVWKMFKKLANPPSPLCDIWWHFHEPPLPPKVSRIIWMAPKRDENVLDSLKSFL